MTDDDDYDDSDDRTVTFALSVTWDNTKIADMTAETLATEMAKVMLATAKESLQGMMENRPQRSSGWWTGTIQSDTGELITYRWESVS